MIFPYCQVIRFFIREKKEDPYNQIYRPKRHGKTWSKAPNGKWGQIRRWIFFGCEFWRWEIRRDSTWQRFWYWIDFFDDELGENSYAGKCHFGLVINRKPPAASGFPFKRYTTLWWIQTSGISQRCMFFGGNPPPRTGKYTIAFQERCDKCECSLFVRKRLQKGLQFLQPTPLKTKSLPLKKNLMIGRRSFLLVLLNWSLFNFDMFIFGGVASLKLTANAPENRQTPKRKLVFSIPTIRFQGAMLISSHKSQVNPINHWGNPKESHK